MRTRHDGGEIRGRCAGKLVSKEGRSQDITRGHSLGDLYENNFINYSKSEMMVSMEKGQK